MAVHHPPCLTDRQAMDPPLNTTHHGNTYAPVSPPAHLPCSTLLFICCWANPQGRWSC